MESQSLHNRSLIAHTLTKMAEACDLIIVWNEPVHSVDDYLSSPDGMQKMAATSMLLESIGEGAKKIDRLMPGFLEGNTPDVPWKSIKGLRDHIAHGYFNIDADIIFDIAINEVPHLKPRFAYLREILFIEE